MSKTSPEREKKPVKILLVGGYGFFGSKLCTYLKDEPRLAFTLAGRSLEKAERACLELETAKAKFQPLKLDRNQDINAQIGSQKFDLILDLSGPFQTYGDEPYRLIIYALENEINYIDIADGTEFVTGISEFDQAAKKSKRFVLSGVSTYPVLTGAVINRLRQGLSGPFSVKAGISPSPHTDMGRSVVEAIASYAGKPFPLMKDGAISQSYGLTETLSRTICAPGVEPLDPLVFSNVDVPDGRIMPEAIPGLSSIWNAAGPKPVILHRCLLGLAWLVRLKLLPGLSFLSPVFHFCMKHIAGGRHRGGMFVELNGKTEERPVTRSWHLIAEGDHGPFIPILPIASVIKKGLRGDWPKAGARAPIGEITLDDYEAEFAGLDISTGVFETGKTVSLYEQACGDAYSRLAQPIQDLHKIETVQRYKGRCKVTRGSNPLSHILAWIFGLPKAADDTDVKTVMTVKDGVETWERFFAGKRMVSTQEMGRGKTDHLVVERFGPIGINMAVLVEDGKMIIKTQGWSLFNIPLPKVLKPHGDVYEHDADGRFNFHVDLQVPIIGRMVKYEGWLEPEG